MNASNISQQASFGFKMSSNVRSHGMIISGRFDLYGFQPSWSRSEATYFEQPLGNTSLGSTSRLTMRTRAWKHPLEFPAIIEKPKRITERSCVSISSRVVKTERHIGQKASFGFKSTSNVESYGLVNSSRFMEAISIDLWTTSMEYDSRFNVNINHLDSGLEYLVDFPYIMAKPKRTRERSCNSILSAVVKTDRHRHFRIWWALSTSNSSQKASFDFKSSSNVKSHGVIINSGVEWNEFQTSRSHMEAISFERSPGNTSLNSTSRLTIRTGFWKHPLKFPVIMGKPKGPQNGIVLRY